jgi:hypothetical protein
MNPPQSGTALALAFVSGTIKTISSAAVVGSMSVILVLSYASIVDFHSEVSRVFHREVSHL